MSQFLELNDRSVELNDISIDQLNILKLIYHNKIKHYMNIYSIDYLNCTGKTIDENEIIKYSEIIKESYFQSEKFIDDLNDGNLFNNMDIPLSIWTAFEFGCHSEYFSDFFNKYDLYGESVNGEYNITRKQRKFVENVINKRAQEQDGGEDMKRAWGFARDYINGDYDSQYSDYISENEN